MVRKRKRPSAATASAIHSSQDKNARSSVITSISSTHGLQSESWEGDGCDDHPHDSPQKTGCVDASSASSHAVSTVGREGGGDVKAPVLKDVVRFNEDFCDEEKLNAADNLVPKGGSNIRGIPWALPTNARTSWATDEDKSDSSASHDKTEESDDCSKRRKQERDEMELPVIEDRDSLHRSEDTKLSTSRLTQTELLREKWRRHWDERRSRTRTAEGVNASASRALNGAQLQARRGSCEGAAAGLRKRPVSDGPDEVNIDSGGGLQAGNEDRLWSNSNPCTIFTPRSGKVRRISGPCPALVVGLDAGERLCFLGAARVRCGHGEADVSGYTLRPIPWGPYVRAHSPRWMSLLTICALDENEISGLRVRRGGLEVSRVDGRYGESRGRDDIDAVASSEDRVEDVIDDMAAQQFSAVVVLRPLEEDVFVRALSARDDADALYADSPIVGAGGRDELAVLEQMRDAIDGSGERLNPALRLASALRLPGLQIVTTVEPGLRPFIASREWAQNVDEIVAATPPGRSPGAILVCGATGVGKSSLCRYLVNRMLARHPKVAYMDCDLGQPEFTTPGQVSLHLLDSPILGPPHAHMRRPDLAFFIGTTTSKPEPLLFSAAVRSLAARALAWQQPSFADDEPVPPLIVNTDGWVKGMGEDILGAIIDTVRPRHVLQIVGTSAARRFELDRLPEGCQVHPVEAWVAPAPAVGCAPPPARPSSQDLRTLRLVSYFLGCWCSDTRADTVGTFGGRCSLERSIRENHSSDATASDRLGTQRAGFSVRGGVVFDPDHKLTDLLTSTRPRRVPWKGLKVRVMNGPVPPGLILHAINGALVGLMAIPRARQVDGQRAVGTIADDSAHESHLECLHETPLEPCVGLGIVRSVDVAKKELYVLSPERHEALKDVNALVKGSLQLPVVMTYSAHNGSHPYFSSETVAGDVIKNRKLLR